MATGIFGVDGQYDIVRATFTDGSNVPRMPPMRVGGGTYWRNDNWFVRMGLLHAFGQSDLGAERDADGRLQPAQDGDQPQAVLENSPWGAAEITTGLVGNNLLDVDMRNSVQFHKDEILMPGRSIKFFLNAKFGGVPPVNKGGNYKAPTGFGAPIIKAPMLTAWSWAGLYIGANIGYSAGRSNTDAVFGDFTTGAPLLATGSTDNLNGAIGGIQAGYNWQGANGSPASKATSRTRPRREAELSVPRRGLQSRLRFRRAGDGDFEQGPNSNRSAPCADVGTTITPDAWPTSPAAWRSARSGARCGFTGSASTRRKSRCVQRASSISPKAGWTVGAGLEGAGRQRDREDRVSLHGFRHHLDVRHQSIQRDPGHALQQFPHHRQHRAGRFQLQARSRFWSL